MLSDKPVETFLISNHVPFRVDLLDQTVSRVPPLIEFYDVSQPDPRYAKLYFPVPTEVQEQILDHLVVAYLRSKEFGSAAQLCRFSFSYMKRMYREWLVDKPHCSKKLLGWAPDGMLRRHFICYAREIHRFFYLGMVLFDYAFDVGEDTLLEDAEEPENAEAWRRDADVPVVTINHPYGFSKTGVIKPHHLVSTVEGGNLVVYFDVIPHPLLKFPDFGHAPVLAWTGSRFCDCLVMDAAIGDGVYEARKVVYPILAVRIDTIHGIGSVEWKAARAYWERFGQLVKIAFEGADLYVVDRKGRCEKV